MRNFESLLIFLLLCVFVSYQINDETREMEILTNVLKRLEAKESGPEAEKINELIKVCFDVIFVALLGALSSYELDTEILFYK